MGQAFTLGRPRRVGDDTPVSAMLATDESDVWMRCDTEGSTRSGDDTSDDDPDGSSSSSVRHWPLCPSAHLHRPWPTSRSPRPTHLHPPVPSTPRPCVPADPRQGQRAANTRNSSASTRQQTTHRGAFHAGWGQTRTVVTLEVGALR